MFLLGLTEQLPKVIYVTFEQTFKAKNKNLDINQESIDTAFGKVQREPDHYFTYLDYKIVLLNSKFSNKAGASRSSSIFGKNLPVTNIERTLIDITVRPAYSGGVTEVLKAYERAANIVSINKLVSILLKLDYIYPYHQSIGFYLQKSGCYKERQIDLLREKEKIYDFYLTYNMLSKEYSKEWHLYYPSSF
jgi:predicted transcriptional regulator of viral defense system